MTEPSRAVFLSYASQDAQSAQRICEALRAGGIEVWFDQSELRGGDTWDRQIRRHIKSCALFIPIISKNTHDRDEGYFRLEWSLAVERSQLMAADRTFLLPVVIDHSRENDERVPDRFRDVQWTRLPGGETPSAFVDRVRRLLSPGLALPSQAGRSAASSVEPALRKSGGSFRRARAMFLAIVALVLLPVAAYFGISKRLTPLGASFAPPPHSIAVLPFVNMSGDKEQEYFSDGLTEEILNSLAEINELQVAARTSAFAFRGKDVDIGTIAHRLNVASVLEGSVRRAGNTVRVTTQLINAETGYHLWSHTYDRDLGDVLRLETEIAGSVASALKVSLLGEVAAKIELGGTRNPGAFDAYLRGRKAYLAAHGDKDFQSAIAAYTEAIGLDPNYALAFAERSLAFWSYSNEVSGPIVRESYEKAQSDARRAIAIAPDLAEGHLALAQYFESGALDFSAANQEFERALALAPGDAQVLRTYGHFAVNMGRFEVGIASSRRAVVLDPLSQDSHSNLGIALYSARQIQDAIAAFKDALALDPENPRTRARVGFAYYALGDFQSARASCERNEDYWESQWCLAVTYDRLGRHPDAEAQLSKLKAAQGEDVSYQYASIYAQWGNTSKALEWLDTAVRVRDAGLEQLKVDPQVDPLRKEPRFQSVMRELKFPN